MYWCLEHVIEASYSWESSPVSADSTVYRSQLCMWERILSHEADRNSLRSGLKVVTNFWTGMVLCCPAALQKWNIFQQYIWKLISLEEFYSIL